MIAAHILSQRFGISARRSSMTATARHSKVPEVILVFWIIKIAATTLGETGGDTLSMSLTLGYAASTIVFAGLFLTLVAAQIGANAFRPFLYWAAVIGTTLVGTTLADFADRSLGIGYLGGSLFLATLTFTSLALWRLACGTVSVASIASPKVEAFYWVTILFSNTLGTALGDWLADTTGIGFEGGALVFAAALAVLGTLYATTSLSRTFLFWAAFILTRPLGATVGDLLTKPHAHGGLDLSRFGASIVLLVFIVACILAFPQRAGDHPGAAKS